MNRRKPRLWAFKLGFLLLITLMGHSTSWGNERVRVVTTIPILKNIVQEIGGENVSVKSLLRGVESPHTYGPKPSDLTALQKTQLFIQIGAGLEGWVEGFIKNAQHENLLTVTTSQGVALLEDSEPQREKSDHTHFRNPHIWLDPRNVKLMAEHISKALIQVAPGKKNTFIQNQHLFFKKLDVLEMEIHHLFEGIPNRKIISYHPAWPYFAHRFGITISGEIQGQIGTEPSAKQLASLVKTIKEQNIRVIVSEPQLNPKIPRTLAQETGAQLVTLTVLPGAIPGTDDYFSMMRYNAATLAEALREKSF
ncbi:MAG TPA: metal ABC transporter substrate-binding protein [Nitrospiria bacterium]